MIYKDLKDKISEKVKRGIIEFEDYEKYPVIWIETESIPRIVKFLRDELGFDWLSFITAIDRRKHLELIYLLYSTKTNERICLKTKVYRKGASVPSIYETFEGAAWHENEVYDLFGITFENHPYPKRIFTPAEIDGHPLLKDFRHPYMVSSKLAKKPSPAGRITEVSGDGRK